MCKEKGEQRVVRVLDSANPGPKDSGIEGCENAYSVMERLWGGGANNFVQIFE